LKNVYLVALTASLLATASFAGQLGSGGVSSIRDNGRINGDPSWTITCGSGWGVVRRSGDTWADNTGYTYSNRLWTLSLEDFANKMCE
jgi:hypothetical protein